MSQELENFLSVDKHLAKHGFKTRVLDLCHRFPDRPIETVAELCALSDAEILRAGNVGRKTLDHLRYLQKKMGVHPGLHVKAPDVWAPVAGKKCPWCASEHEARCPTVKAHEYHEDGALKRVEFFASDENTRGQSQ